MLRKEDIKTPLSLNENEKNFFTPWLEADVMRQGYLARRHASQEAKRYPKVDFTEILILSWNGEMYWKHLNFTEPSFTEGSAVPIVVTFDRNQLSDAHIVIFHMDPNKDIIKKLKNWQMSALLTLEPFPKDKNRMEGSLSGIDILISFSRYSEVVINYKYGFWPQTMPNALPQEILRHWNLLDHMPDLKNKSTHAIASYFISDCVSWRMEYINQLSKFVSLHSYGKCNHTSNLPSEVHKVETQSRYRFSLSFENSIMEDYVTEKFYDGILSDSIPIYLGAPNYLSFLPNTDNKMVVSGLQFPNPAELARFMVMLASNDTEYLEYFQWRKKPILEGFNNDNNFENKGPQSWISRLGKWYIDHLEI